MNNLPISILDSKELYVSSKRIFTIIYDSLSADLYAKALCGKLDKGITDMEKAMGRALTSDFTPALLEKDAARDNAFLSIRDFVKSGIHGNDPVKAGAAKKVSVIIQTIGNGIYRHGYADETTEMNTLIADLRKPENALLLKNIAAEDKFQVMCEAQDEFEKAYHSKVTADSAIDYPLLKDSKKRIAQALYALLTYIESNSELNAAQFSPVEQKINEVITDIVAIARARITREENEKKKGTNGTQG